MKIDSSNIVVEGSSSFGSKSFEIGNSALLIHMLRSNIYSNPIGSICREISCNARDAHVEVGTPDLPIKITLPTSLDKNLYIQDFGPGISPSRMEDIFLKYGNSTKNNTNDQIGGFGLGGKSPFAYTDQFTVITISNIASERDYNHISSALNIPFESVCGKNVKCIYFMHSSTDECGGIKLMAAHVTDEHTGTTFCIGVKDNDVSTFIYEFKNSTKFWPVKPEFVNCKVEYETYEVLCEGEGWQLLHGNGCYGQKNVIIDGVCYPLNIDSLNNRDVVGRLSYCSFNLFFKTGDLNVSISRENLYYEGKTLVNIIKRIQEMKEQVEEKLADEISSAPDYVAAVKRYVSFEKIFPISNQTFLWNGTKVAERAILIKDTEESKFSCTNFSISTNRSGEVKLKSGVGGYVSLIKSHIIINDLGKNHRESIINAINHVNSGRSSWDYSSVFVINGPSYNEIIAKVKKDSDIDLNHVSTLKLSDYFVKKTTAPRASVRNNVSYICGEEWVSDVVDIANFEGYYVILSNYKKEAKFEIDGNNVSMMSLFSIARDLDIKVYGIAPSTVSKIGDNFRPLKEKLEEMISDFEIENTVYSVNSRILDSYFGDADTIMSVLRDINYSSENELFSFYKSERKILNTKIDSSIFISKIYRILNRNIVGETDSKFIESNYSELIKVANIISERYSLLKHFSNYYNRPKSGELEKYISMVDELSKLKEEMKLPMAAE